MDGGYTNQNDFPINLSNTQRPRTEDQLRKTYRVKGIPPGWNCEQIEAQLYAKAEIQRESTISVRSLALDIGRPGERQTQTAVISFSEKPQWCCRDRMGLTVGDTRLSCDSIFDGFTPLSSVPSTEGAIDCIVLPGWGGHPIGSFMAQESPHVWLIDRLAHHFPTFRVWTYGYGSPLRNQLPLEDVYEFAHDFISRLRRMRSVFKGLEQKLPIIFIAHSLGGLLFKEIMIKMDQSNNPADEINVQCTYGALFFGVPSAGMDVEAIAEMVGDSPARTTLNDLDRRIGNRLRDRQHKLFCESFGHTDSVIARFYELLPTPTVVADPSSPNGFSRSGPPKYLVDYQSATLGRAWETEEENVIGLHGDHSTMVKLPEDFDHDYEKIYEVLERFSVAAPSVILSRFFEKQEAQRHKRSDGQENAERRRARIACLESLSFSKMNTRQQRVRANLESTCMWALRHPSFINWRRPRSENQKPALLWIKGKAGSGKSTLMKYLVHQIEELHHLNDQEKHGNPNAYIATFFFDARGTQLEKSPLGMFRTLLRELLEQDSRLIDEFMKLYDSKMARHDPDWRLEELRDWTQRMFFKYGNKPTYIFVDALDECEESDMEAHTNARDLVNFFEDLLQTGSDGESDSKKNRTFALHLCLSSRHYPYISVQRNIDLIEIHMEHENSEDIRRYIQMKLPLDMDVPPNLQERALPSDISLARENPRDIRDEVARRAKGVFLWVVLAVHDLKLAQDRGKSMRQIRDILDSIPDALNDFFDQILVGLERGERSDASQLLQFMIFARRGVDALAAQQALAFGAEPPPGSVEQWRNSENYLGSSNFKRWVQDASRGLVEVVSNDGKQKYETLQFIHETVRVFFLDQGCRRLLMLYSSPIADPVSMVHDRLVKMCFNYLAADDVRTTVALRTMERPAMGDYETLVKDLVCEFPFLAYATCEIQGHAVAADSQPNGNTLSWMLRKFAEDDKDVFTTWRSLQKLPPTQSIPHLEAFLKWKDCSHRISALEFAAMWEFPAPLSTIWDSGNFVDAEMEYALSQVARTGNATAAKSLVEFIPTPLVARAARIALQHTKDIEIARILIKCGPDLGFRDEVGQTELHRRHNEPDFIQLLLDAGAEVNAQSLMKSTALHLTTNPDVVRLLLQHGADRNIRNLFGLTASEMVAKVQVHPNDQTLKLQLHQKQGMLKERVEGT